MAQHIGRGVTSSPLTPYLHTFIAKNGVLIDPFSMSFSILDTSDAAKVIAPVVVVPKTAMTLAACQIGLGHYAAPWSVPGNYAALGRHLITWYTQRELGDPELSWSEPFDVIASVAGLTTMPLYALISDILAMGVPASVSDARLLMEIEEASRMLSYWTGRRFIPEYKEVRLDGVRGATLMLDEPIIAVTSVEFESVYGMTLVEPDTYVVYNRHLSSNVHAEDDRDVPRLVRRGQYFGRGLPVFIKGVWGYTDRDGSPTGKTPTTARYVVVRMVLASLRNDGLLAGGSASAGQAAQVVLSKRTREQSVTYSDPTVKTASSGSFFGAGDFTGDPAIDMKIHSLCRPLVGGYAGG